MKKIVMLAVVALLVLLAGGTFAIAARPNEVPPPSPGAPAMAPDTGAGELLVVVVGGVHPTRTEAQAAADAMPVGDLQGYYVVPVAQFQGFREQLGAPGDFALVSVFRTQEGAQEFASFAHAFGYPAEVLPSRVRSLGGLYAGLGQEAAPDGSGPLTGPIPGSLP